MESVNVIVEADEDRDDAKAGEVARILIEAYPGHPWHIRVGRGVIVVKHMKASPKFGMCLHYNRVVHDAVAFKRSLVRAGGEFLERSGLSRGQAHEGDVIKAVEGIPEKHLNPISMRVLH